MKKILIVDDNPDVIFSVCDGLKSLTNDFEFLEANSGKEAIELLKKETPDLILLDIMMPDMDGWGVAATIKGYSKTKKIPIIFLTAKTDDLSKGMGSLTAEDYIEKPFDLSDIENRLRKTLKMQ